jgi:hypothetical protein
VEARNKLLWNEERAFVAEKLWHYQSSLIGCSFENHLLINVADAKFVLTAVAICACWKKPSGSTFVIVAIRTKDFPPSVSFSAKRYLILYCHIHRCSLKILRN